jgi:ABC-2 type transport system permease protein
MFLHMLRFELSYQLRRPLTYLYAVVFFLLAFGFMSSDAVIIGGGMGLVRKNSPYALTQMMIILTAVGQVITTAIVGTAVLRDFNFRTHELLFTTRLSRLSYLGGRFVGSYIVMLIVYLGIPLGALVGTWMPWLDAEKLLPFNAVHYVQPYLLFVVTTLFLVSAIFFAVGALTRNIMAIYTQGILLLVAWSVSQEWLRNLDRDTVSNAVDAFGFSTFELTTRYWTVAEKNSQLLGLEGMVLTNRLIWVGIAAAIAMLTFLLFRFESAPRTLRLPFRRKRAVAAAKLAPVAAMAPLRRITPAFDRAAALAQFTSVARYSFQRIVRDRIFLAIATIGAIDLFMNAWYADFWYEVTSYPVTARMAEAVAIDFFLFMLILTTIFAGEAVWRERSMNTDQIADALPVSSTVVAGGKILAVVLTQVVVLTVFMLVAMLVQTIKGYTNYEPVIYIQYLFGGTLPWMIGIALFAFTVHALVENKFLGHVVIIVYWVATIVMGTIGLEHQLYQFGTAPDFTYSDMNGFGHFLPNLILSAGYTNALGLALVTLAILAWRRGTESGWKERVAVARQRWVRVRLATAGAAAAVLLFGGFIFYNTNVLNDYRTSDDRNEELAEWERTYSTYEHLVPPRIQAVDLNIDLVPERRAYTIRGRYLVRNESAAPIDSILINFDRNLEADSLQWSVPSARGITDDDTGTYLDVLATPLQPGDSMELRFTLSFEPEGFPNAGPNNRIVENGTFLESVGPSLGYNDNAELSDDDERRKQKLPEKERLPDLDDPAARRNSQFSIDSDYIRFAATVSTAPDQIAVAPGNLEREWTENGRRYFRYVMNEPMFNFATVVSARYQVRRDKWNDVDIEVYYHEPHDYNIDRMIASVKASLDYFTQSYAPYQFKVVRIVEFPRYADFAQSFPTTVPYSEGIGFIMRVRDRDDDLDMPYFVTAHEIAHQWWGHQVVGANAQGSAMMVESMAEYAALVVMERKYGQSHVNKFLRYELDRYLRGRAGERKKEQPLIRTENQAYIHYQKGSLALYSLRDYIGEDAMNRALRGYITAHRFEEAPYSTARDFVGYLRRETPDSLQYLIADLFETITLYSNKTDEAGVTKRADGKYIVKLTVHAEKVRADSLGNETQQPLADYIDIGVFGEKEAGNALGKPLYVRKHRLTERKTTIEIVVDEEPRKAGIDPYNKLIDRAPSDNVKELRISGG